MESCSTKSYSVLDGKILKSILLDNEVGITNFLEIDIMSWFGGYNLIKLYKIYQSKNSIDLLIKMADKPFSNNNNEDDKLLTIYQIGNVISSLNSYGISINDVIIGKCDNSNMILELDKAKYHITNNSDKDSIIDLCELLNAENQTILANHLSNLNTFTICDIINCKIFEKVKKSETFSKNISQLSVTETNYVDIRNCVKLIINVMKTNYPKLKVSSLFLAIELFYRYGKLNFNNAIICAIVSARIHSNEDKLTEIIKWANDTFKITLTSTEIINTQFDMINKLEGKFIINLLYSKYHDNLNNLLTLILAPTYEPYLKEFNDNISTSLTHYSDLNIDNLIF